jgi:hypothetical protein
MNTRRRLLGAALAAPVVLASCKVKTINYFPSTPARVRAANLMLGSAAVDVVEGDNVLFSAIAFETGTDYVELENTRRTFSLRFSGQTTILGSLEVPLSGEQPYTLVAFGTNNEPRLMVAADVTSSIDGSVQIRIVDAAHGSPSYDIYITEPLVPFDDNLGPNIGGISNGSSAVSLRFPHGVYRIRVAASGTRVVVYDTGAIVFNTSESVDVVLYTLGSTVQPAMMLMEVDTNVRTLVPSKLSAARLVNAAFQSGTIVGKYDGTLFTADVPYRGVTDYFHQAAGVHTVTVEATATPGAAIATLEYDFPPSHDVSLVAVGFAGAVQILALADDNRLAAPGNFRMRFVNASSDNAAYDVFAGDTKQISALPARTASPYVTLPATTYTFTFRDPASGAIVLTVTDVVLDDGRVSTLYATGVAGDLQAILSAER